MNREEKIARDLARLQKAQQQSAERLQRAQVRMAERFSRAQQQLLKRYGVTSDSQQRIINAALELLKTDGLNNLSLRKLAGALNMQAPALYWHFKSKEVLIDHLAEAILHTEFADLTPRTPDQPWQEWLTSHMLRLRKAMLAYPDGGRIVAGAHLYPAVTLAKISEISLESLVSAGVPKELAHQLTYTSTHYTFGTVIEEQSAPSPELLQNVSELDLFADMPYLHEVAQNFGKTLSSPSADPDAHFKAGLQLIIRGANAS